MSRDADSQKTDGDPDVSWIGRTIAGRFRLLEILGTGGIAVVFRAEDTEFARTVAVKVLSEPGHGRNELRGRFEREARALAALSHPNIVALVDFGVDHGRAYLVMELLKGRTLGDLLEVEGTLDPPRAFRIVKAMVRALAYAHGEGVLHRDLKPDNVFLQALPDTPDHVRLLDFGFAKFVDGDDRDGPPLTQAGTVFGTPRYMAPEQLTGGGVDGRVDFYAAAVILYEALAGRRPFEGEVRDVLRAKVVEDPPSLGSIAPDLEVAPALEEFLRRALATRRDERYADATQFTEALDAIPQPAVKPKDLDKPKITPKKRMGLGLPIAIGGIALGAIGLFACAAAGIWLLWPADAPEPAVVIPPRPPPPRAAPPEGLPDPWTSARELAAPVAEVRAAIDFGESVSNDTFRALREHASAHPDDPFAQLLLGHVFTDRGMRAMAVGAYERAASIDRSARGDPRMIVNLIHMASQPNVGSGPARAIRDLYGTDAIPVINSALDRAGIDPADRQRLETLRDSL